MAIKLKIKTLKPKYAGKMNFYLSIADNLLKHPTNQLSKGLILFKSKKITYLLNMNFET